MKEGTVQIKAIETVYNGYWFRSRLEARWAVFFDQLSLAYEYEKEGYDLGGVQYLPDFWLPDLNYWIEIKGQEPSDEESSKARGLAAMTSKNVYLFVGQIVLPDPDQGGNNAYAYISGENDVWDDESYWWCECRRCGQLGLEFRGRSERLPCSCQDLENVKDYNFNSPRIRRAFTAARAARFQGGKAILPTLAPRPSRPPIVVWIEG